MDKIEIKNKQDIYEYGWEKTKLCSLITESKEKNYLKKKLPVFSISNKEGFILQSDFFSHNIHSKETTNYKIFKEYFFSYNPARINVGSIALCEDIKEGLLSPMYVVFKTNSNLIPKYLKYFIQTYKFNNQVINNVVGTVRESLNYSSLENFDLFYPKLIIEQKKIAEILETVDEEIEKTDGIIKKYERIKNGLMQDLFSKGITAFQYEKAKLIQAITKAFKNSDHKFGREENLVDHLKEYLYEQFPDWDIDGKVERNNQIQRPDIIIHKRRKDENLFAIEVKKNGDIDEIKQDIKKLEDVLLGNCHYEDAVFIGFDIENSDEIFELSDNINFVLVTENGEIKTKARVRSFKDSSIGKIPEKWVIKELSSIGVLQYGYTTSAVNDDTGIKLLRITDIQEGKVYWPDVPFCVFSKKDIKVYKIEKGDILFARTGATTGKTFLIDEINFIAIFASYLIRIKINAINNSPQSKFLFYFLNSDKYWKQIAASLSGSTQQGFNAYKLKKLRIPILPYREQLRIVNTISQLEETLEKENKYKQKLERIKKGLMEDLLTGKVRVNHLIEEDD